MNRDTFLRWLHKYAEARIDIQFLFTHGESYEESKRKAQKAKQKLLKFHAEHYPKKTLASTTDQGIY